jgi:hypothetical protein
MESQKTTSCCLIWGRQTKRHPFKESLGHFALRRLKVSPTTVVEPLQVLPLESAFLAGVSVDEESLQAVGLSLEPFPSFEHYEKSYTSQGQENELAYSGCLCDACSRELDDDDAAQTTLYWDY